MTSQLVPISPRQIRRRRLKVFGLMFVSTLFATLKWITVIPSDSSLFATMSSDEFKNGQKNNPSRLREGLERNRSVCCLA